MLLRGGSARDLLRVRRAQIDSEAATPALPCTQQALRSEAERVSGPSSGLSTLINSILATAEANRAGGGGGGAAGIPYRRLSHGYGGPDDSSDDENKMTDEDDDDGEDGDGAPAGGAPGDRQEQLMYDDDGDDDGDGLEDDDMGDLGGPRAEPLLLLNRALDEPHDERWGPGAAGEGGEQAAMQRRHEALQRLVRSARFPSAAPSRVVGGDAGHDEMLRRGPPPVSFLQAGQVRLVVFFGWGVVRGRSAGCDALPAARGAQVFSGVQRLSAPGGGAPPSQPSSEWKLVLRIHHCEWDKVRARGRCFSRPGAAGDQHAATERCSSRVELAPRVLGDACAHAQGTLSGVMEAQQPSSTWARRTPPPTIVTFWEAEVVDNLHHTFCTDK